MIEHSVIRQHPDWSKAEQKAAVIERLYRDDFTADEMKHVRHACVAFHERQTT